MRGFKIFAKLFLSHTAVGLFAVVTISLIFYLVMRDALIQRTVDQLSSINILKKNQIEDHFIQTEKKIRFVLLSLASDDGKYAERKITDLVRTYEFDNVTIVDSNKKVIYTAGVDSISSEMLSKITLANNISFKIVDVSIHEPLLLYVVPVPFRNQPAYMIVKEDFGKIQRLLQVTTGMGNTGESYLVGADHRMRSVSRFMPEKSPMSITVETKAVSDIFSGVSGGNIIRDYRDVKVLSFYRMLDRSDLQWAIISEIDFDEAMKPVIRLRNYLLIITFIIICVIVVVTFLISDAISKPILRIKHVITTLSKGIIPDNEIKSKGRDEIADIALAVKQLVEGLKRTTNFAYEIGEGNFESSFTSLSDQDTLGKALIHMRNQLRALTENEIRLVREKTAAVLEGQENERRRIIRELHDGVGQLLTAVSLRVNMIEANDALKSEIKQEINETIAEVKRISYNVMPNSIVDFGLEAALKGLCNAVKKYSGLEFDLQYIRESDNIVNFDISIAVFRIVQEGLNNIVKHANATRCELYVLDKEDEIYLLLKDNGTGFDEKNAISKNGLGLNSIKERARLLNGTAEIHSISSQGTTIEVHIPIK
jgi:two-component system NarL family sensor kinase